MLLSRQEMARQISGLERLCALASRLAELTELEEMLHAILVAAADIHGADQGLLSLCSGDDALLVHASVGLGRDWLERARFVPAGVGACGAALATRCRVIIDEATTAPCYAPIRDLVREHGVRAVHATPIFGRDGRLAGVISVHLKTSRAPTGLEMRLADMCARHATDAIETARIHKAIVSAKEAAEGAGRLKDHSLLMLENQLCETERARARVETLLQLATRLGNAVEAAEVARVVGEELIRASGAVRCLVFERAAGADELQLLGAIGFPPTEAQLLRRIPAATASPLARAIEEERPIWVASDGDLLGEVVTGPVGALHQAVAALPLRLRGAINGAIAVSFGGPRSFDESERTFFTAIAGMCAQAIERARLFESEAEMRRASETALARAQEADRKKDEFLAMLGHELRNPLSPILTALNLLRLRGVEDGERERTVIERQVNHLVGLVDDLLDISRITRGKIELRRERIEVYEIVAKAIEMASPLLERQDHRLVVSVPRVGLQVDADPSRLAQVLSNLLTNAAKYTEPGGEITISGRAEADKILLAVRDTGIGIDPELLPEVFELFVQAPQALDRAQGGLGLGLAIVRALVDLHGGRVCARSDGRGLGSEFELTLPLAAQPPAPPPDEPPSAPPRGALGDRRVLIVDDNPDAAEMLAESLSELGYEVCVAHDGPEALRALEGYLPDVALLDLGLPVMDGYELARRLRAIAPAARLVAITGYGQDTDRARTQAAGFEAHLIKPVSVSSLDRVICSLTASPEALRAT